MSREAVLLPYEPQVHDARDIAATVLLGDGRGGFRATEGAPFPLPGCKSPRRVTIGDVTGSALRDFVVTCMGSDAVLLFTAGADRSYRPIVLAVPTGKQAQVAPERGVAVADLTGNGRSAIIVSNGTAGTITILSPQ